MVNATSPLSIRVTILAVLAVPLIVATAGRFAPANDAQPVAARHVGRGFDVAAFEGTAQDGLREALRRQAGLTAP